MPFEERPRHAYILAKRLAYFYSPEYTWTLDAFTPDFPVSFISGLGQNDASAPVPNGVTNLGRLNQREFYDQVAHSRVLVGIGSPFLSPSPYDALCLGVPFINPVLSWNKEDPENRAAWTTQHDGFKDEYPPYVYHVKRGDVQGLWAAVKTAMDSPIDRSVHFT